MTGPGLLRQQLAEMIAAASDGNVSVVDVLAARHPLSALGLTSLARIRLIDAIEDSFGVDLDLDEDLSYFEHVDVLTARLADRLAAR